MATKKKAAAKKAAAPVKKAAAPVKKAAATRRTTTVETATTTTRATRAERFPNLAQIKAAETEAAFKNGLDKNIQLTHNASHDESEARKAAKRAENGYTGS